MSEQVVRQSVGLSSGLGKELLLFAWVKQGNVRDVAFQRRERIAIQNAPATGVDRVQLGQEAKRSSNQGIRQELRQVPAHHAIVVACIAGKNFVAPIARQSNRHVLARDLRNVVGGDQR